ncbi:hypothetical protein CFBP4996_15300 [Agrobacterium leguminum]|uniref:hypothetical protein n=1 Tax=Agrobacterium TaxID=357 RepID=UPI0009BAC936|nr:MULTISPECIES: hypothetical protein [Agrobacterium]WFS67393.1 hypothetical protein CFBP4996_15300 [Agrobacterium leguminum]
MKIYFEVSFRLTRGELQNYIKSKPGLPREEAMAEWIDLKYKSWIDGNICSSLSDFELEPNFPTSTDSAISFTVDFKKQKDGEAFLAQMGGRIL